MIIQDKIYGRQIIKEPIFIELIDSQPVQRLKKISQFGLPDEYYHKNGYSRYDHSIGVMFLLKRLNSNQEEQIAGLLHDISHYAFSHVADWVFGYETNENLQDSVHAQAFQKGEIHKILIKYNYNPKKICKLEDYKLLDQDLPNLCADRIDYTLREFENYNSKKNLNFCLKSLIIYKNNIVFNNKKAAQIFGQTFIKCQSKHWAGFQAVVRYHLLSSILKQALKQKIITRDDFSTDDEAIIQKILHSQDKNLIKSLNNLKKKNIKPRLDWRILKKKKRFVGPKYLENGEIYNLSRKDQKFFKLIQSYLV